MKTARSRSQSRSVESVDVRDAGRRELARHLGALGRGRGGEPLAEPARVRVDLELAAALGVDEPERPDRLERLLARVAHLDRDDLVAAREAEQRPRASRAGRGSRRRSRRARAAAPRPRRRCSASPSETSARPPAPRLAVAEREQQPDEPRAPLRRRQHAARSAPKPTRPTRFPRTVAAWPTASATPSATSALRRSAVPKRHRRRRVEHEPRDEHALGEVDADVRLRRPRGDVPVDQAHVVARHVRPHLRELGAAAEQRRAVVAREQPVDAPRDRQLERLEQRVGNGPRPGPVGRRLGAERAEDADHAAAGLPSSSRGCGTAAITASSTSSADRSSASAWYVSTRRWRNASFTSARMSPGIT